ncbi:MAG: hypothetical protein KJ069_15780 [Anaerolineae bacterium]|nr:hypothetical protein [Anaerolineae bacterium]
MTLNSIPGFNPQTESAISRFDPKFMDTYGQDSVFVNALADLWTIAMSKMLLAHNMIEDGKPIILISDNSVLEQLTKITHRSEILTRAIFQEPFGFAEVGIIQQAFEEVFGLGLFAIWLEALENRDFEKCMSITGRMP